MCIMRSILIADSFLWSRIMSDSFDRRAFLKTSCAAAAGTLALQAVSDVRAQGLDVLKTSLRDSKAYGGTTVLLVVGIVNDKISYADAYKRTQEEIRKALPLAEELGIKIAFENVWNMFLLSPLEF